MHTWFLWGNQKERDYLEDPSVEGRIILRRIFWKWNGVHGLIDLAQDSEKVAALVNAVMNLRFP